jgi:hypothetical protein
MAYLTSEVKDNNQAIFGIFLLTAEKLLFLFVVIVSK